MSSFTSNTSYIGIIANSTSPQNRQDLKDYLGVPQDGFFKPLEFKYQGVPGGIIPLDIQPQDILTVAGSKKARMALLKAVDYLAQKGAKVICLAASTKRLAGKDGELIKNKYPDIIFTIGDNATNLSFELLLRWVAIELNRTISVFCLGGGFLGEQAVEILLEEGFKNITVLSEYISGFSGKINLIRSLKEISHNDYQFMISCTHKYNIQSIGFLTPNSKTIEVAVPPGINPQLFLNGMTRYDSGDYYLDHIEYDFSPHILSLPNKNLWYGCFTEAVLLSLAHDRGVSLVEYDLFKINSENKKFISTLLKEQNIKVPLINFHNPKQEMFLF